MPPTRNLEPGPGHGLGPARPGARYYVHPCLDSGTHCQRGVEEQRAFENAWLRTCSMPPKSQGRQYGLLPGHAQHADQTDAGDSDVSVGPSNGARSRCPVVYRAPVAAEVAETQAPTSPSRHRPLRDDEIQQPEQPALWITPDMRALTLAGAGMGAGQPEWKGKTLIPIQSWSAATGKPRCVSHQDYC